MPTPPDKVLRFYGNIQYALECIKDKQIAFVHTNKLNDPFDPNFQFPTDFNGDYSIFLKSIKSKMRNMAYKKLQKNMPKKEFDGAMMAAKDRCEKLIEKSFVFSTCEVSEAAHPKDNLYMWGHYANGHRGLAIEFDTRLLTETVPKQNSKSNDPQIPGNRLRLKWVKIEYCNQLNKISGEDFFEYFDEVNRTGNGMETKLIKIISDNLSIKCKDWERESEWRLVGDSEEIKDVIKMTILADTVTAVYLGCRMSDDNKEKAISETTLHFPNAKIFKTTKRDGEFALDFEEIRS